MPAETEWEVRCAAGHRFYERLRLLGAGDPEFTACPECGEPRKAYRLSPVDGQRPRPAPSGDYTAPRAFDAEGARVGIVACDVCGAALLLDPAVPFDVLERHREWHARDL